MKTKILIPRFMNLAAAAVRGCKARTLVPGILTRACRAIWEAASTSSRMCKVMIAAGLSCRRLIAPELALVVVLSLASFAVAADWPQYRGVNRDGISTDRLNKQWTGAVTNPLWRLVVPNSLSSLTVSGGLDGSVSWKIRRPDAHLSRLSAMGRERLLGDVVSTRSKRGYSVSTVCSPFY